MKDKTRNKLLKKTGIFFAGIFSVCFVAIACIVFFLFPLKSDDYPSSNESEIPLVVTSPTPRAPDYHIQFQDAEDILRPFASIKNLKTTVKDPPANLEHAPFEGNIQLYGEIIIGDAKYLVVVDQVSNEYANLFIDTNLDNSMQDETAYIVPSSGTSFSFQATLQWPGPFGDRSLPLEIGAFDGFSYFEGSQNLRFWYILGPKRFSSLTVSGTPYEIILIDDNANGLYDDWNEDIIYIDLNKNNDFSFDTESNERIDNFDAGILIEGKCLSVSHIDPYGDYIDFYEFEPIHISGNIRDMTGNPLSGITFHLGRFTGKSGDGNLDMTVCPGKYEVLYSEHIDYVPYIDYDIDLDEATSLDVALTTYPSPAPSGQVTLSWHECFDFLTEERCTWEDAKQGDMTARTADWVAQIIADRFMQRGVQDLGDIGNVPLSSIDVPAEGYYSQVDAVVGHTYIVRAHAGEEGHFIIIRVLNLDVKNKQMMIEYLFK